MICLDSSFLIDLFDEVEGAVSFLEETDGELFVPTICLAEIYEGFVQLNGEKKLNTLDWATPLVYDETAARETARIVVALERKGSPIKYSDAQIAGTVRAVGGTLVSRDEEFERVPNLDVQSY